MKELFKILGDKIAAPLWEVERHVKTMADSINDLSRTQARELEDIKHTLRAISEK